MTKPWITSLAVLALALGPAAAPAAFAESGTKQGESADTTAGKLTPAGFAKKALMDGEKEVALAQIAERKSSNAQIKQFATMIVQDHMRANEQLRLLVKGDGSMPRAGDTTGPDRRPSAPGTGPNRTEGEDKTPPSGVAPGAAPSQSAEARELNGLTGAAFDNRFLAMMVADHEKAVDLFERAAAQLETGAAKTFAENTVPALKKHLEEAKSLKAQFGK